jgi:hypothetical protein
MLVALLVGCSSEVIDLSPGPGGAGGAPGATSSAGGAPAGGATAVGGFGGVDDGGGFPMPECGVPGDCGADRVCLAWSCVNQRCVAVALPNGTLLPRQTPGDCLDVVCDGAGDVTTVPNDADMPNDGNACTIDACRDGTPTSILAPQGTACGPNGLMMCDGNGNCL